MQTQVEARLQEEVVKVQQVESKKAADANAAQIKQLEGELAERSKSLRAAKEQELALRTERRKLQEAQESLALEVQRTIDEERGKLKNNSKRNLTKRTVSKSPKRKS